jgi:hypothetical protein
MSKHGKAFAESKLKPGEAVIASMEGYKGRMMGKGKDTQHNGALFLTDQRVVFYRKGFLGEVFDAIPLDKLTSVETKTLLGHKTLVMHTSNDEMEFRTFDGDAKYQSFVAELEKLRSKPTTVAPVAAGASVSSADRIRQLSDLLRDGLITQEEFDAKRREILAAM